MKTNRIKHQLDRKPLSSEEINELQDFNQVLNQSSGSGNSGAKGGYKSMLYIAGVAAIALLSWGVYSLATQDDFRQVEKNNPETMPRTQEVAEDLVSTPLVKPPVAQWDIPFSNYTLSADQGGQILHGQTVIDVPPQCLIDKEGNSVHGNVDYKYREFHDGIDFILSGIPMNYDSAGTSYHFRSAGMCELRAYQNGEELKLAPGKQIKMDMISYADGTYNLYKLDEDSARAWVPKGHTLARRVPQSDSTPTIQQPADQNELLGSTEVVKMPVQEGHVARTTIEQNKEVQAAVQKTEELKKTKPVEPRKENKNRPQLKLEVLETEFPELASFTNVTFEVAPEDTEFKPAYFDITWEDIKLERYKDERFKMVLSRYVNKNNRMVLEKVNLIVMAVIPEKDYPAAKAKYDSLMKEYNSKLEKRKADEAAAREAARKAAIEEAKRQQEEARKQAEAFQKQMQIARKAAKEDAEKQAEVNARLAQESMRKFVLNNAQNKEHKNARDFAASSYFELKRSFAIDDFGIWNSDNPVRIAGNVQNFEMTYNMDSKPNVSIYHQVINNRELMSNYSTSIKFNPKDENLLFAILPDGKLAYNVSEEWEQNKKTIHFEVSDKEFRSADEVKNYLKGLKPN